MPVLVSSKHVDQLKRGDKTQGKLNKHLDVVRYQGNYVSLSNQRLAALMMCQSLHRDHIVKVWCKICNSDTEEFQAKYKTANRGLRVDVCDDVAQHFAAALFQRGEFVMHELYELQETPRSRLFGNLSSAGNP